MLGTSLGGENGWRRKYTLFFLKLCSTSGGNTVDVGRQPRQWGSIPHPSFPVLFSQESALKKALSGAVVAVAVLLSAPPMIGSATTPAVTASRVPACSEGTSHPGTVSVSETGKPAEDRATVELLENSLRGREYLTKTDFANLKFDRATVLNVRAQDHTVRSVTIPIDEEGLFRGSGVTYIVDDGNKVLDQAESRIVLDEHGFYVVQNFRNGELKEISDTGVSESQVKEEAPATVPYGWGEKIGCVAATLGVSYAVAQVIVGTCGTSCAAAETGVGAAICAACITGIVAVGGASLTAVYNCFQL